MAGFVGGADRQQVMLLPERLDDYVDEESPVQVIDAFVEMLDLAALGFDTLPETTGRPGYLPGLMLRIYLYGYLNQEFDWENTLWNGGRISSSNFNSFAPFDRARSCAAARYRSGVRCLSEILNAASSASGESRLALRG